MIYVSFCCWACWHKACVMCAYSQWWRCTACTWLVYQDPKLWRPCLAATCLVYQDLKLWRPCLGAVYQLLLLESSSVVTEVGGPQHNMETIRLNTTALSRHRLQLLMMYQCLASIWSSTVDYINIIWAVGLKNGKQLNLCHFYHAVLCIAWTMLSQDVSTSVCHTLVVCWNG